MNQSLSSTSTSLIITALIAVGFALIHIFSRSLRFIQIPRSRWLSGAGGVSVAYVFVHIQVTGIVRNLVVADIEREYNLTLDRQYYTDYENKPAIIAQSMALAPDPGDITKNPQKYYNQRLAVTGEIEDIQNANIFTLDEEKLFGATDLLVLNPQPKVAVQDDQFVAVTGVLRPFVLADFEREYDLGWDLQLKQSIEAEYSTKPVFVADSVYPSAISD
ncbi:MAG: hypothetical protein HC836_25875 [Richelia sp. RM2_1_2]|nr:hypothetical protein [Richelia sp. SM1_7_0]NJN08493.1 hypothetical protein [Richelia sp. RM1_1_1]NJO61551.1 hypothetical protein [Richelia sp. RM2_1_2]